MPMVVINAGLNEFSTNRNIIHVLPTPLSPIRSNLNKKSNFFSILNEREAPAGRESKRWVRSERVVLLPRG